MNRKFRLYIIGAATLADGFGSMSREALIRHRRRLLADISRDPQEVDAEAIEKDVSSVGSDLRNAMREVCPEL